MKAYELLATPDRWTQGIFARDKDGVPVISDTPEAFCFCLEGALTRCYGRYGEDYEAAVRKLSNRLGFGVGHIGWNDDPARTHAEVVAVLKELDI